jgi:hypothetical protein
MEIERNMLLVINFIELMFDGLMTGGFVFVQLYFLFYERLRM